MVFMVKIIQAMEYWRHEVMIIEKNKNLSITPVLHLSFL